MYTVAMADNVTAPIGDPTLIATDEVEIDSVMVHAQRMKLLDGRDGSSNPVSSDTTGALWTGKRIYSGEALGAVTESTHADGELMCAPINLGVHPDGILSNFRLVVGSTNTTIPLDAVHVVLVPVVPSSDISRFGGDGDVPAYTWNDWRNAIVLDNSEFTATAGLTPAGGANVYQIAESPVGWSRALYVDYSGPFGTEGSEHQLYALVICDGGSSTDYTVSGLLASFKAEWTSFEVV